MGLREDRRCARDVPADGCFLAAICWYVKGKGAVPVIIDTLIIAVMFNLCFAVGWIYIGLNGIFEALK